MYQNVKRVLISKEQIAKRNKELGAQISEDYKDKELLMVCILKGSSVFFADLIREITIPVKLDFMSISSYGNGAKSSGEVKVIKDLDSRVEGKHVIIVEDIVDSGYTLSYLTKMLKARNPASLKVCSLLDKPSRREVEFKADYVGFEIENEFVIGYGLDYAQIYRNLPEVCILDPKVYS